MTGIVVFALYIIYRTWHNNQYPLDLINKNSVYLFEWYGCAGLLIQLIAGTAIISLIIKTIKNKENKTVSRYYFMNLISVVKLSLIFLVQGTAGILLSKTLMKLTANHPVQLNQLDSNLILTALFATAIIIWESFCIHFHHFPEVPVDIASARH